MLLLFFLTDYWYILYTQKPLHNKARGRVGNRKKIAKPKAVKFMLILPLLREFRFPFFNPCFFGKINPPRHSMILYSLLSKLVKFNELFSKIVIVTIYNIFVSLRRFRIYMRDRRRLRLKVSTHRSVRYGAIFSDFR